MDEVTIEPGVVHRDANPDDDAVMFVCFVGSGSVMVSVDGPTDR